MTFRSLQGKKRFVAGLISIFHGMHILLAQEDSYLSQVT